MTRVVVARDGIEPSTFRFSVGGSNFSGYDYESVCNVFVSASLHYDPLRIVVLLCVCAKLVMRFNLPRTHLPTIACLQWNPAPTH